MGLARQVLTPELLTFNKVNPPPPHLKLCLGTVTHNYKWVKTTIV